MKKVLALLLAIAMLAASVASCGAKTDTPADTTTAPTADTTTAPTDTATTAPAETLPPELQDTLPETTFHDAVFTTLIREETKYEMQSDEISGDLLSDAVHKRNTLVEERFGVDLQVLTEPGDWTKRDTFTARVSNSILGGDHEFDLVMTSDAYLASMPIRGLAYNLTELESLDFTKKWWHKGFMNNAEINGSIYIAAGDAAVTVYEYLEVVFFNKKLAAENGIPDLYALVESGTWTWDKMMEYVLTVGSDVNGDGIYDVSDIYGLGLDAGTTRHVTTYWETNMSIVGADGLRDINLPNEKYLDTYNRLYAAIHDNTQVFYAKDAGTYAAYDNASMFINDQFLFLVKDLGDAVKMKEMESEYGIIPFPKYDTTQQNYISTIKDSFSGMMVSSAIQEPDMVGTVIEALSMYGYQDITPAYYETALKLKYLSDETAMKMIDLIRDSVVLEFTMIYTNSLNLMFSLVSNSLIKEVPNISSSIKAESKIWQKMVDKLYSDYEKIGQ